MGLGTWDAVIDVSNVCWDHQLPPTGTRRPVWSRLHLVMAAWRRVHGDRVRFELVADDALVHDLVGDTREYGRMLKAGTLAVEPVADVRILAVAQERQLHVLTRDHYVDHRRAHPWIESAAERFHRWRAAGKTIEFMPLGIASRSAQDVSRAVEIKDLKRHRLDPNNPRYRGVLQASWQCTNSLCPEAAHWQGHLLVWPMMTSKGEPRCPTCDGPLLELGPRGRLHEMVVEDYAAGEEIMRFPLEVDVPVTVGRGMHLKGVNLEVYGGRFRLDVGKVSRKHALLRVEEPRPDVRRLVVTDLGSSNGTRVEQPVPGGTGKQAFGKPRRVQPGKQAIVMAGERLVLGDAIMMRLSGKKYVMGATGPLPEILPATRDPAAEEFGRATMVPRPGTGYQ
jgi:FHA domain